MSKNLVIVESPAKAKTIEKYLGKDFTVRSSFGHIRDLPKKGLSIDKSKNFEPTYEISPDKKKVISDLKKLSKTHDVWLASDEDREGEAIAWHLCIALGLNPKTTKRIVFHEITKPAIIAAIEKPRTVDLRLVDAQQARRVLDRLVGYELSPVLWKKVRAGLSAGRVQSVAVRIIVEREREIKDFTALSSFRITGDFLASKQNFTAELNTKPDSSAKAEEFLTACIGAEFKVISVEKKPGTRNPGAPFTTSTLQQEASRRLGYSVRQTMSLAQRLYESGLITYMRTDSTILSGQAIGAAEKFIISSYGKDYHQVRQYKTKNSSAQEAHEAIRPTDFSKNSAGNDEQQKKLYKLIWQRAVSSQMAPAKVDRTEIVISVSNRKEQFVAKGEILIFDGFLKVYGGGKDDTLLPFLKQSQAVEAESITATETFSRAPARYSEATLVRAMEEMGIGRPSTYAPTISTIQDRGYIEKRDLEGEQREINSLKLKNSKITKSKETVTAGADKNKLLPTPVAEITTDFLTKYFMPIVDYEFTVKAEKEFDDIADGKTKWNKMISEFYNDAFKPLIKASADVTREETSQSRTLGADPKSGKPIVVRFGRYGPMLQRGETAEEEKPAFAPMPDGATMDNVTLEQALPMFDLPRTVGTTPDGKTITADLGRFGPYVQVEKMYVSIKDLSPFTITESEARQLIADKQVQIAERNVADFGKIKILRGPYGPYVTDGKKNARIPKDIDPTTLDKKAAQKLLDEAPAKKRFVKRKFTKKK
ncbi:type I DNA topoisomerase [Candidatus Saccharibacteria bacterium]|nr:type I DNA topoisomerase [Candidatus Saccharibacteria bacterium]